MAFKSINEGGGGKRFVKTVTASKMEKGDELVGYVTGIEASRGEYPGFNIIMRTEEGDVLLYTSGTLKYACQDKKIKVGLNTRIVAEGEQSRTKKNGKSKYDITVFTVEQDEDDRLDEGEFNAIFDSPENVPSTTKEALKNGIAARANALAGVAGGRK